MVQPLRRAHLRIWLALALLLPCLIAAAVLARRSTPPANPGFRLESAP